MSSVRVVKKDCAPQKSIFPPAPPHSFAAGPLPAGGSPPEIYFILRGLYLVEAIRRTSYSGSKNHVTSVFRFETEWLHDMLLENYLI